MKKSIDDCYKAGRNPKAEEKDNVADNFDKDECYKVGNNYVDVGDEKFKIGKANRNIDDAFKI